MLKMKNNKTPKASEQPLLDSVALDVDLGYTIEYRNGSKWNQNPETLYKYMSCRKCGQMSTVGEEASATTCHDCVREMVEPPQFTSRRNSSGRPAGWHFMAKYVDQDGNVFHRGIEQTALKGKFKTTVVEKKQKISKNEKRTMISAANVQVHKLKKQLKTAKLKKDIKRLRREIAKLTKIGSGKIPRSQRFK